MVVVNSDEVCAVTSRFVMEVPDVDPVLLRTFRSVLAHRSMARAAEELGFVPSAVSQQVTRLERLVGIPLLTRTPGLPIAPTAAGRQVEAAASTLMGAMADFVSAVRAASGHQVELRVAIYGSAASQLLPRATVALLRREPHARVRVVQAEPEEGLRSLVAGGVDLIIAYRYLTDEARPSFEVTESLLARERLLLVRARHGDNVGPDDALPATWVAGVPGSPSRRLLEHWASVRGLPLDVRYESEDPQTVLALCEHGLGQGLVPESILAARRDAAVATEELVIEGEPLSRQVLAMTRSVYMHPYAEALCRELRTVLSGAVLG